MKKFFIYIFLVLSFSSSGFTKETTFKKELFDKAQAEGKVVIVSSWIKYCTSCASQMKVLDKAKKVKGTAKLRPSFSGIAAPSIIPKNVVDCHITQQVAPPPTK